MVATVDENRRKDRR